MGDVSPEGAFDLVFGQPIDPMVPAHFLGSQATASDVLSVAIERDGEYIPVKWHADEVTEDKVTI